jgi:hypothetical protein
MKTKYMSSKIGALALASVALVHSTSLSQAAVVWQDDFNSYSNGNLSHQVQTNSQGTVGFGGNNWYNNSNPVINSGVVTNTSDPILRNLGSTFGAQAVGGVLWLSFDWGQNSSFTNSYGGLTFFEGDSERALIGNTWGAEFITVSGAASTGVTNVGYHSIVAKILLGAGATDSIQIWANSSGIGPVDVSGAGVTSSATLNLDGISRLRILGNNAQTFDNLKIGTTMASVGAVPEPSAALLGGLSALAMLRRRRR